MRRLLALFDRLLRRIPLVVEADDGQARHAQVRYDKEPIRKNNSPALCSTFAATRLAVF